MKKREFISLIMAITMIISASSCGKTSADTGAAANADDVKAAFPADNAAEESGKTDDAAGAAAKKELPAVSTAPAAAVEETEAPVSTRAPEKAAMEAAPDADLRDRSDGMEEMTFEAAAADGEGESAKKKADGERLSDMAGDDIAPAAAAEGAEGVDDPIPDPDPDPDPDPVIKHPEAGLLTAGEWNDNDNWGFFTNLVNAGTIRFPSFSLDPTTRCAVTVKTADGKPAANAKVRLLGSDGKVIWSAVSDKKGRAYLFTAGSSVPETIEAELGGVKNTAPYSAPKEDSQGNKKASTSETEIVIDGTAPVYKNTEVMFIVDTTGSMGDEMLFLQSEFSAITREIGTENIKYAVSFYRDEGDEYVTKHNGFTDSVDELQRVLNNETADGGGDYPEAVAQVLTETLTKDVWSKDSVKLAFLIFDAPPHDGTEKELLAAAKAAGEKGIRIVPVVSSDSDRSTELFARSLAIMSGGTYVFLTDDSGIGGGHLEPIIGDYKVEKLYDIIIRVIKSYQQ